MSKFSGNMCRYILSGRPFPWAPVSTLTFKIAGLCFRPKQISKDAYTSVRTSSSASMLSNINRSNPSSTLDVLSILCTDVERADDLCRDLDFDLFCVFAPRDACLQRGSYSERGFSLTEHTIFQWFSRPHIAH